MRVDEEAFRPSDSSPRLPCVLLLALVQEEKGKRERAGLFAALPVKHPAPPHVGPNYCPAGLELRRWALYEIGLLTLR